MPMTARQRACALLEEMKVAGLRYAAPLETILPVVEKTIQQAIDGARQEENEACASLCGWDVYNLGQSIAMDIRARAPKPCDPRTT